MQKSCVLVSEASRIPCNKLAGNHVCATIRFGIAEKLVNVRVCTLLIWWFRGFPCEIVFLDGCGDLRCVYGLPVMHGFHM